MPSEGEGHSCGSQLTLDAADASVVMVDAERPRATGLSVVVPCFNEVDNVDHACAEILGEFGDHDLEVIFVDDGSTDGTLAALQALANADHRVHYISFTRNFGFEAAFSAGYRYARKPWILHLDADQQFPASEGRRLLELAEQGYDAVFGVRVDRDDPLVRRLGSAAFHFISGRLLRIEVPRGATAFRVLRASLARTIVDLRLGTPYFLATVPRLTSRYTTLPVSHRSRTRGESKVNVRGLARHAMELFIGRGQRLTTGVSTGAVLASILALLGAMAAAIGLLGPRAAGSLGLLLGAVVLVGLSFVVRYLVSIAADQARPRQFYVREATLPIRDEDMLDRRSAPIPDPWPAESAKPIVKSKVGKQSKSYVRSEPQGRSASRDLPSGLQMQNTE